MLKKHKKIFILLLAVITIAAGILSSGLILRYVIQEKIRLNGFPNAKIDHLYLAPNGILIDHINLDGNDFSTIEQLFVTVNWFDLIVNRDIAALTIKKIALMAEIGEHDQFKLAGWDAKMPSSGSGAFLPIQNLNLPAIILDVDSEAGGIRLEGKIQVTSNFAPDAQDKNPLPHQLINFSLWSTQNQLDFNMNGTRTLTKKSPDVFEEKIDAELLEARVDLPNFHASRLSGSFHSVGEINGKAGRVKLPQVNGHLLAGSIKTLNGLFQNVDMAIDTAKAEPLVLKTSPAGYPNVSLTGRWNLTPPQQLELTIESADAVDLYKIIDEQQNPAVESWLAPLSPLTLQFALRPSIFDEPIKQAAWAIYAGKQRQKLDGTLDYHPDNGHTVIHLNPLKIAAVDLNTLTPLPKNHDLAFSKGTMNVDGEIGFEPTANSVDIKGPLAVTFDHVAGNWNNFLFADLGGPLYLERLAPFMIAAQPERLQLTKAPQNANKFSLSLMNDQGVLAKGSVALASPAANLIKITPGSFAFAAGTLGISPFSVDLTAPGNITTKLSLNNIDIEKLAGLLGSPSLEANGKVSGIVPLSFKNGQLSFSRGQISNSGSGYFKYQPESIPPSLQGDDARMQTVRKALSDFHFELLNFEMDGPMNGHMTSSLKAKGTNPVFGERPIEINLKLEGDLGKILQQALQAGDLSSTLRLGSKAAKPK